MSLSGRSGEGGGGAVVLASVTCGTVIAHHIAGKATRDALFLSTFPVTGLPEMVIGAAVVSFVAIVVTSRAMRRMGPGRLVPAAFTASGLLFLGEWALVGAFRPVIAVAFYLHLGAVGALLISGFWSLVNERFDPHTAKRYVGRIAAGGTMGGVVGGVLAERVAAVGSLTSMLPLLALLHLAAAVLVSALGGWGRPSGQAPPAEESGEASEESGLRVLARVPYLRNLALLALLGTVAEGLLDYVFKARATEALGQGDELLRLFALFYTGVSVLTFFVQTFATRPSLEKLGLARTVAAYPGATFLGSLGALAFPGLASAAGARGSEAVVSNSLYRSGTELFFTPVPRREKRASKSFIDVGAVRMGDVVAAGVVELFLALGLTGVNRYLLVGAALLSGVGVVVAMRLHRGYVEALQSSLVARGEGLDRERTLRSTRTAIMQTMGAIGLTDLGIELAAIQEELQELDVDSGLAPTPESPEEGTEPRAPEAPAAVGRDPVVGRIQALRSGDPDRVRNVLREPEAVTPETVPHLISLLAWDEVMPEVSRALHRRAGRHAGTLLDALLDRDRPFAVRRRIPRVLEDVGTGRVFDGLVRGLDDSRFEVRYRCSRALVRIREARQELRLPEADALDLIYREVDVDRRIWESRRILDRLEEDEEGSSALDSFVRRRANRSLEHVCNLLALYLPPEPVKVAFRGLHTDDPFLRGTALEYLETVLTSDVQEKLWPLLESGRKEDQTGASGRSRDEVLQELLRSNASIVANLETLLEKRRNEDEAQ